MHTLRPALVALPLLAAACGRTAGAREIDPEPPVPVRTAAVETRALDAPVVATGTLHPKDELHLSFKIPGVVARVLAAPGDAVRRGQLLATLDPGEIDAQVARGRAGLARAERELARAEALYRDSVATLQQAQDARTGVEVARSELRGAEFNRRYATIVAPADGVVLRRLAAGGELVAPGAPVLVLGSRARGMVLRAGLADRDALRLRPGDPATVVFDALPGRSFPGEVREVSPAADPATGTWRVEVALASGELATASGLVGRLEIRPGREVPVATVPVSALLEADGDRGAVFTTGADGRALRLQVAVGGIRDGRVAIPAGLDGVERVVTEGAAYLRDGVRVEVVP
jgi:membrane fusion protein, multidrug efflux system